MQGIKTWPLCLDSQLWRAMPAPELPVDLTKASAAATSWFNLFLCTSGLFHSLTGIVSESHSSNKFAACKSQSQNLFSRNSKHHDLIIQLLFYEIKYWSHRYSQSFSPLKKKKTTHQREWMLSTTVLNFNSNLIPKLLMLSVHYLPYGKGF